MIKADDKVTYEEDGKTLEEPYTNFQELQKRVEFLQDMVEEMADIMRDKGIRKIQEIEAPYFDENKLYEELEVENEMGKN